MATTTRTNTTYADALDRLHAMEESLLDLWSRYRALKAIVEDLEPGGGGDPADLDRIYSITVGGSQSPGSPDPQAPSAYDNAEISMHLAIFGWDSVWIDRIESMTSSSGTLPVVELLAGGAPNDFYTSGHSTWSLTWANSLGIYDAVADSSRSLSSLCLGNGMNANSLIDNNDSLYSRIKACETRLSAGGL